MAPRDDACRDSLESHSTYANYGVSVTKAEHSSAPVKTGISLTEKYGINSVHGLLQCPTCAYSIYPPIQQFPRGHTLCPNCRQAHNSCPTCHFELCNVRCLSLEKVAKSLELPCRYQSLGCHDLFPCYSKLKHEKHCPFHHTPAPVQVLSAL